MRRKIQKNKVFYIRQLINLLMLKNDKYFDTVSLKFFNLIPYFYNIIFIAVFIFRYIDLPNKL